MLPKSTGQVRNNKCLPGVLCVCACACVHDTEWLSEEMGDGMDWGEEDFVPLYTDCITSRPLYQGPT